MNFQSNYKLKSYSFEPRTEIREKIILQNTFYVVLIQHWSSTFKGITVWKLDIDYSLLSKIFLGYF
eukprot:UN18953